jgi:hypothetical protein
MSQEYLILVENISCFASNFNVLFVQEITQILCHLSFQLSIAMA